MNGVTDADGDRLSVYTYNTGKMTVIITLTAAARRTARASAASPHPLSLSPPTELHHCYISSRLEKAKQPLARATCLGLKIIGDLCLELRVVLCMKVPAAAFDLNIPQS